MTQINKMTDNAIENLPKGERRTFNTIDKALNWADHYQKTQGWKKDNQHEGLDKLEISRAMPEDRRRYLMYGLSMLRPGQYIRPNEYEMHVALLKLVIMGYPKGAIAQHLGTSLAKVEEQEKLAMKRVKDAIMMKKRTGVPILGG